MTKLTKKVIDNLKPSEKDCIIFDENLPGFGLRVYPSGRKTFLVQYRLGGRTRKVTIGRFGTITPDMARKKALELLSKVSHGENPSENRKRERMAPNLAALCDRFYNEYVIERCKPSTQAEYLRCIEKFIKPNLGAHRIEDITRPDIATLHHSLRHIPYQANRVLGVISKMFNLAEVWGLRPDNSNPTRHVGKYKEHKRERYLSPTELDTLGKVLNQCEFEGSESIYAIAAFRLLIYTGCRLSEIQFLKWADISEDYIHLPNAKTGPRKVPQTPQTKALLKALPQTINNPYVCIGIVEEQAVTDLQKPWRRIRKLAKLEDVRIHDLRHTYASNAVAAGMDIVMVGKLLGHTQIQTTMRYAHLADDPIKKAANLVADTFGSAITPQSSANVINIHRG